MEYVLAIIQLHVNLFSLTLIHKMPKKRGRGRPKIPKTKALGKTFGARLRPREAKLVSDAIKLSGMKGSEWIRDAMIEKAQRG